MHRAAPAAHFLAADDLVHRLKNRVQLTTDGFKPYLAAVEETFGNGIDYAQLIKVYGRDESRKPERRYSPAVVLDAIPHKVVGDPDPDYISTSYVERLNLTMRMSMRRYTRLTNGFSKKVENLAHAVALHFMFYNFGRIHQTLRVTPAMQAGLTDHVWSLEEIAQLADLPQRKNADGQVLPNSAFSPWHRFKIGPPKDPISGSSAEPRTNLPKPCQPLSAPWTVR